MSNRIFDNYHLDEQAPLHTNATADPALEISPKAFDAVLFDMDGIVTKTADLHAKAWKKAFDSFLLTEHSQKKVTPFDIQTDYLKHVDGKPRFDGVQSFLKSRGFNLPWGQAADPPGFKTVAAIGNLKNDEFQHLLESEGVEVYETTVALIQSLKNAGIKVAVITASENGIAILKAANVIHIFDVKVDGIDAKRLSLKGKPYPDTFLQAARQLGVIPGRAAVIEDAEAGVEAGHNGGFALVIGVDRSNQAEQLKHHGANFVVNDLAEISVPGENRELSGMAMADLQISEKSWKLSFVEFDPELEGRREALCALGNGYMVTRASAPESIADNVHAPGTYLAGGYNRLNFASGGAVLEHEDLVNLPNWLALTFRIGDGDWFDLSKVEILEYEQDLDLLRGLLHRRVTFNDSEGRKTTLLERRFAHMRHLHLCGLETIIRAENWSGQLTIRTALDGRVQNIGTKLYGLMNRQHLQVLESGVQDNLLFLKTQTSQSCLQIAQAVCTNIRMNETTIDVQHRNIIESDFVAQELELALKQGDKVCLQKIASLFSSHDLGISEVSLAAREAVVNAPSFETLINDQVEAWRHLWRRFDLVLDTENASCKAKISLLLHLHSFHVLQTASPNSIDLDVGIPARGWSEGYQGHVFWDDLFVLPFLNLRMPEITQSVLKYRYRRLDQARSIARSMGIAGARYPWQSGSSGREETPPFIWYPMMQKWIPDYTHLEVHVNAAIAFDIWQYYQVTGNLRFMYTHGADMLLEIARFFAHMAQYNADLDRFEINGVVGPDEYHQAYPDATRAGIDNNAYTNVMAVWTICRALELLKILPTDHSKEICERLKLGTKELALWQQVSRRMYVPMQQDGIICQFSGYELLQEFPWRHDGNLDVDQLGRVLKEQSGTFNQYKVSKQPDVLMLFYLFSLDELKELLGQLGYAFNIEAILKNIEYYVCRTANTSTLSRVALTWVLSRMDRANAWALLSSISSKAAATAPLSQAEPYPNSWEVFREALGSDYTDIQGGTTAEGIHLGAMAGTVDIVQRCYTGIVTRDDVIWLNPRLPKEMIRLAFHFQYRHQVVQLEITRSTAIVSTGHSSAKPIKIGFRDSVYELLAGQRKCFKLEDTRMIDNKESESDHQIERQSKQVNNVAPKLGCECDNRTCRCHVSNPHAVCKESCNISAESPHQVCECGHPECGGPLQ